jgi:hypothetical protein
MVLNFTIFDRTIVSSALTTTIVGVLKGGGSMVYLHTCVRMVQILLVILGAM